MSNVQARCARKKIKANNMADIEEEILFHPSLLGWAYLDSRCPDFVGVMQVLFYCISLVIIKSALINPILLKSFEMKRPFMVWIDFI